MAKKENYLRCKIGGVTIFALVSLKKNYLKLLSSRNKISIMKILIGFVNHPRFKSLYLLVFRFYVLIQCFPTNK